MILKINDIVASILLRGVFTKSNERKIRLKNHWACHSTSPVIRPRRNSEIRIRNIRRSDGRTTLPKANTQATNMDSRSLQEQFSTIYGRWIAGWVSSLKSQYRPDAEREYAYNNKAISRAIFNEDVFISDSQPPIEPISIFHHAPSFTPICQLNGFEFFPPVLFQSAFSQL